MGTIKLYWKTILSKKQERNPLEDWPGPKNMVIMKMYFDMKGISILLDAWILKQSEKCQGQLI